MDAFAKVVQSAGKTLVLVSGGEKMSDEEVIAKARKSMECGATGLIFGRNIWQRPHDQALAITRKIKEVMSQS